jgi:hypothetical protein
VKNSFELQTSSFKLQVLFFGQSFLFQSFHARRSFLLFALKQKVEQKDQGKPQRSAGFARLAHNSQSLLVSFISCCVQSFLEVMKFTTDK